MVCITLVFFNLDNKMKTIQLTKGQVALVDDEDYEWLMQWKWHAQWSAATKSFYGKGKEKGKCILMHRKVMNTPERMDCDHRNHNTLDNQKSNLRNVTRSQNMMNQNRARKDNRLGILGVQKHFGGFRAYIYIDGKQKCFPTRKTIEEAVGDRKRAESDVFGKYGSVNE
jgi:hypothetical protein